MSEPQKARLCFYSIRNAFRLVRRALKMAVAVLAAHRIRQHDELMRGRSTRPDWNNDDLVFPSDASIVDVKES